MSNPIQTSEQSTATEVIREATSAYDTTRHVVGFELSPNGDLKPIYAK